MKPLPALTCAVLLAASPALALPTKSDAARQLEFGVRMAIKGSWREAAFRFEKAVEADPNDPWALNNLGVALESLGRFERAEETYERALALDPRNDRIQENLKRLRAYLSTLTRPAAPAAAAPPPPGETAAPGAEGPGRAEGADGP